MPFVGPLYSGFDFLNNVRGKHNISMYGMCMNGYDFRNFNRKNLFYMNGCPHTLGNIARFINKCRWPLFTANCSFEEHSNEKELCMKWKASCFVVVRAICSLSPGDELLINYNFIRPPTAH
jgi:hypothetical protein